MKVGDLVRYNHDGWRNWYGIIVKIQSYNMYLTMWNHDNNRITSNNGSSLEVISESR
jgi:hypothetical protein